jgi:hypothetical protein
LAVYFFASERLGFLASELRDPQLLTPKSLGLVLALAFFYGVFLVALLSSQFRRPKITPEYIQAVRGTRAYTEITEYLDSGMAVVAPRFNITDFFSFKRKDESVDTALRGIINDRIQRLSHGRYSHKKWVWGLGSAKKASYATCYPSVDAFTRPLCPVMYRGYLVSH